MFCPYDICIKLMHSFPLVKLRILFGPLSKYVQCAFILMNRRFINFSFRLLELTLNVII